MEPLVFNVDKEGWALEFEEEAIMSGNTVEHIKDAAPVLGKYFDILCIRTFPSLKNREDDYSELYISQFVKYAGIPVVSLESATLHPLQSLTDIITITECCKTQRKSGNRKLFLTWAPHVKPFHNVLPIVLHNGSMPGAKQILLLHILKIMTWITRFTKGARILHNQDAALKDADFVYVKNWSTYKDYGKMYTNDPEWMLTNEQLLLTNNAKVMHCLPVRRNVELSDEVLDGPHSIVTQQAGNRVWAAQAVLSEILKS